jgi:hypothetical protein
LGQSEFSKGEPLDFGKIRDAFGEPSDAIEKSSEPAADVLQALEAYEPILAPLREAAMRPQSQFRGRWPSGPYTGEIYQLGDVLGLSGTIRLRVYALLAVGKADQALGDWRIHERLSAMFQREPTLLATMLRTMLLSASALCVQRGLAQHQWTEPTLAEIELRLRKTDLLRDYQWCAASQRAAWNTIVEDLLATPRRDWPAQLAAGDNPTWISLVPRGWVRQNQLRANAWYDEQSRRISMVGESAVVTDTKAAPHQQAGTPYTYLLSKVAYSFGDLDSTVAVTQNKVQLCRLAIALERFRIRTGTYPAQLEELTPGELSELPKDAYGEPFRYGLRNQERLLYSVDEAGEPRADVSWPLPL